jgi:hypothetical protein
VREIYGSCRGCCLSVKCLCADSRTVTNGREFVGPCFGGGRVRANESGESWGGAREVVTRVG